LEGLIEKVSFESGMEQRWNDAKLVTKPKSIMHCRDAYQV